MSSRTDASHQGTLGKRAVCEDYLFFGTEVPVKSFAFDRQQLRGRSSLGVVCTRIPVLTAWTMIRISFQVPACRCPVYWRDY